MKFILAALTFISALQASAVQYPLWRVGGVGKTSYNLEAPDYDNVSNKAVNARQKFDNICHSHTYVTNSWHGVPYGFKLEFRNVLDNPGWEPIDSSTEQTCGVRKGDFYDTDLYWDENEVWDGLYSFSASRPIDRVAEAGDIFPTRSYIDGALYRKRDLTNNNAYESGYTAWVKGPLPEGVVMGLNTQPDYDDNGYWTWPNWTIDGIPLKTFKSTEQWESGATNLTFECESKTFTATREKVCEIDDTFVTYSFVSPLKNRISQAETGLANKFDKSGGRITGNVSVAPETGRSSLYLYPGGTGYGFRIKDDNPSYDLSESRGYEMDAIVLYGASSYGSKVYRMKFPDKDGTFALKSDIDSAADNAVLRIWNSDKVGYIDGDGGVYSKDLRFSSYSTNRVTGVVTDLGTFTKTSEDHWGCSDYISSGYSAGLEYYRQAGNWVLSVWTSSSHSSLVFSVAKSGSRDDMRVEFMPAGREETFVIDRMPSFEKTGQVSVTPENTTRSSAPYLPLLGKEFNLSTEAGLKEALKEIATALGARIAE